MLVESSILVLLEYELKSMCTVGGVFTVPHVFLHLNFVNTRPTYVYLVYTFTNWILLEASGFSI